MLLFPYSCTASSQSYDYVTQRRRLHWLPPPSADQPSPPSPTLLPTATPTSTSARMAIEKGVTEVADSEEEPMTSSPTVVSDAAAADKLSARASAPPQERQDATPGAHRAHRALAECDANIAAERTDGLDVDQNDASINVDASDIDHADTKLDVAVPPQREGAVSGKSNHNLELSQPCQSEQKSRISDMPMANNRTALLTSSTEEEQSRKQPDATDNSRDCSSALQDAHYVSDSKSAKTGEPTAAHASDDPASDCQEPPFMPGPPPDADYTIRCHQNQQMAMNQTADQQENEGPTTLHLHCGAGSVDKCEPSTSHFDPRVHDGASQPISQESGQTARQGSGIVHISEHAVCSRPAYPLVLSLTKARCTSLQLCQQPRQTLSVRLRQKRILQTQPPRVL